MPLYDYECRNCGHRVEVLHGVNAPGPAACDQCGGQLRKLFSTPAIVFKGSGFAKKDFRDAKSSAKSGAAKSDSGDGASTASGSDGASKPDTATGTKSTDGAATSAPSKTSQPAKAAD